MDMANMNEACGNCSKKMKGIQCHIAHSLRRAKTSDDVHDLLAEAVRMRHLMQKVNKVLEEELLRVEQNHALVFENKRKYCNKLRKSNGSDHRIKRKKTTHRDDVDDETEESSNKSLPAANSEDDSNKSNTHYTSERTSLTAYRLQQQTMRCRFNTNPVKLAEFDVKVSPKQFSKIPKYMRGRETCENLNEFLQGVISACFNDKYQLLYQKRTFLRTRDELNMWKIYNEQAAMLPGVFFITANDISRKVLKMIDKKMGNRITMLRHIGFLKEQRVYSNTCYIWNAIKYTLQP